MKQDSRKSEVVVFFCNLNINREALFVLIQASQNRVSKIVQKQTFKELHTCKKIWKTMQKLVNLTTKQNKNLKQIKLHIFYD